MNYMAHTEEKRMLHAKCAQEEPLKRCPGEWACKKCGDLYKKYYGRQNKGVKP